MDPSVHRRDPLGGTEDQGGRQQRDVVGKDYRRIADYRASRTDPDAALLPGK